MTDFWNGLGTGDFGDKGNPFDAGNYITKIDRIHTHKGFTGSFMILNFEVHWSDRSDAPQGCFRDWVVRLDADAKRMKMIQADVNAFVFAAFGKSKDDRTFDPYVAPLTKRAPGVGNPFMGGFLKLEAYNIKVGAEKDKDFTKLRWYPADTGYYILDVGAVMAHPEALPVHQAPQMVVMPGHPPPHYPPGYPAAPMAPPPPPPMADPAKARALVTPGWVLPDGRWYNGSAWVGP